MKDQHRLFAKFVVSYIGILTVTLGVTLVGYQRTLSVSQRKVYDRQYGK